MTLKPTDQQVNLNEFDNNTLQLLVNIVAKTLTLNNNLIFSKHNKHRNMSLNKSE
jgi:hypothetical protein